MNRVLLVPFLCLPLVLASCYSGGRQAGEGAFDGAHDKLVAFIHSPEAGAVIEKAVDTGTAKVQEKLDKYESDPNAPGWIKVAAPIAGVALTALAAWIKAHSHPKV